MGLKLPHSINSTVEEKRNSQSSQTISQVQADVPEEPRKNLRFSPICFGNGCSSESQTKGHKPGLAFKSKQQIPGQTSPYPNDLTKETPPVDRDQEFVKDNSAPIPSAGLSDPHRCITKRLGRLLTIQKGTGNLVPTIPPASFQCTGSYGSVPHPGKASSSQEISYQTGAGQCSSSSLHQQGRLQVEPREPCHDSLIFTSKQEQMAPVRHSSSGRKKRGSGCAITLSSAGVRVVPGQGVIQLDLTTSTGASGRSLRHRVEPQTPMLCGPQPGPSGLCHRRHGYRLEYVEEDLPLSSSESSLESPEQTQDVQRPHCSNSPQLAQEQLVPTSTGIGTPTSTDSQSQTITTSANADCVRFLRNSESPNFMDFMKFAAQRDANIDPQNILFLESDKREPTLRQYDSAVKKLAVFLREYN
ncbi:uncharacterized protein LOC135197853 [Macrobrachium nipponense]|uniref:uncharacterized protein LOC135197853 n=1 Tax=Macrobrachium nipponense TaxID=159736 RepID=UPI0030C7C53D